MFWKSAFLTLLLALTVALTGMAAAQAQSVGDIQVVYDAPNNFGIDPNQDGPAFVIENNSSAPITGGVLSIGANSTTAADSFLVGTVPADSYVVVTPGLSNDGQTGHTFFAVTGSARDTSDSGPDEDTVPFQFTGQQGATPISSPIFTPAATKGPSNDGYETVLNFLGGPDDVSSNNCFGPKVVALLNAPSHAQLLWNNVNGTAALWTINPDASHVSIAYGPFSGWTARAVSEAPDAADWLLWTNTNGEASLWRVTGSGYSTVQYGPYPGFTAVSLSIGSDGNPRLLWDETNGTASLWDINKSTGGFTHAEYGPYAGWTANHVASGATVTDLLWNNTDGTASGWRIGSGGTIATSAFGPYSGFTAVSVSVGPDDGAHLLWDSASGSEALWSADFTAGTFTSTSYGPLSGWATRAIAVGPDNGTRMLWDNTNGTASLWDVTSGGYAHLEFGPFSGWTAVAVSAGP